METVIFVVVIIVLACIVLVNFISKQPKITEEDKKEITQNIETITHHFQYRKSLFNLDTLNEQGIYVTKIRNKQQLENCLSFAIEQKIVYDSRSESLFFVCRLQDAKIIRGFINDSVFFDCKTWEQCDLDSISDIPEGNATEKDAKQKTDNLQHAGNVETSDSKPAYYRLSSNMMERFPYLICKATILDFQFHWSGDYITVDKNAKTIKTKRLDITFSELKSVTLRDEKWVKQTTPDRVETKANPIDLMLGMPSRTVTSTVKPGYRINQHDYFIDIVTTNNRKDTIKASSEATNAQNVVTALEQIIEENKPAESQPQANPPSQPSKADELRKLKGLLDSGAISKEEFEVLKKEVIFSK